MNRSNVQRTMPRRAALTSVLVSSLVALVACKPSSTEPPIDLDDDPELPSGEDDPILEAGQRLNAGDAQGALDVVDAALAKTPEDPELYFARGLALQELGKDEPALEAWNKAVELDAKMFAAHSAIGTVHLDAGRFGEARAAFEAALAIKPDHAVVHHNLGVLENELGHPELAVVHLEEAHRLSPNDADTLLELAVAKDKSGDKPGAIETVKQAGEIAPQDPFVQTVVGDVLTSAGQHDDAIVAYRAALDADDSAAEARLGLIRALRRAEKPEDAMAEATILLEHLPDNPVVLSDHGGVLADLGKTDEAVASFDKAIALSPNLVSAHRRKIRALADAKKCGDAKAALEAFEATKPSATQLSKARADHQSCKKTAWREFHSASQSG